MDELPHTTRKLQNKEGTLNYTPGTMFYGKQTKGEYIRNLISFQVESNGDKQIS